MSPAASDKQQFCIVRGEHRAVSTSSGSITAVLYAATLPVPTVWGHVDELSAGWWRVAHGCGLLWLRFRSRPVASDLTSAAWS